MGLFEAVYLQSNRAFSLSSKIRGALPAAKNVAVYLSFKGLTLVMGLIGTLSLAAAMGISDFGVYARASAIGQILFVFSSFGQEQLVLRGVLAVRTAVLRVTMLSVLPYVLTLLIGAALVGIKGLPVVAFLSASNLATSVAVVLWTHEQAIGSDARRALMELRFRASILAPSILFALLHSPPSIVAFTGVCGATCAVARMILVDRRQESTPRKKLTCRPLGVGFAGIALLYSANALAISLAVASRGDIGTNANVRIILLAYTGIIAVVGGINAEYYRRRLYACTYAERRSVAMRMFTANVVAAVCLSIALAASSLLIPAFLGEDYVGAQNVVAFFAFMTPISFAAEGAASLLVSNGFERIQLIRQIIALGVTCLLLCVLPMVSWSIGLVILIGESSAAIIYFLTFRKWGIWSVNVDNTSR